MADSKMKLKTIWYPVKATDDEKAETQAIVLAGSRVLTKLRKIVQDEIDTVQKVRVKSTEYDKPNWDFKQAHTNGQVEKLSWLLSIIPEINE